jgi:hypothetical protein
MNIYLQLVLIAAVTAVAASGGTWAAGRWLQDRDERRRGLAAGRLVYMELARNHRWVKEFRKGGRAPQSLPFTTSATWEAVQIDVARIIDKRHVGTLLLPYSWLVTLRTAQGLDWIAKTYAKLAGYERQWFDELEKALDDALDRLEPVVWDKEQAQRVREARLK